ncbi:MAG: twin-arginine translocation signal domain-containing protein [Anaerolineales bacterium]|nr:twin-arginine translocation signal domain-containing protein [Anaerolineales bacterium]
MEESQTPLSRRELLKTLAASGGALAAAAFLPAKWTRPVVQAGVLPAHAQATFCDYIVAIVRASMYQDNPWRWVAYLTWNPETDFVPGIASITAAGTSATILNVEHAPAAPYSSMIIEFEFPHTIEFNSFEICLSFSVGCQACDIYLLG